MGCPFVSVCKKKVDFEYYNLCCNGRFYGLCSEYQKKSKGKRTPREWRDLVYLVDENKRKSCEGFKDLGTRIK